LLEVTKDGLFLADGAVHAVPSGKAVEKTFMADLAAGAVAGYLVQNLSDLYRNGVTDKCGTIVLKLSRIEGRRQGARRGMFVIREMIGGLRRRGGGLGGSSDEEGKAD
jgi:hypothetical protein